MTEKQSISKWNALKEAAAQARRPYERHAWLNTAFYLGEQYTEWADDIGTIRKISRDPKQPRSPRPVVNKINHFVNQQHAFALQARPEAAVLPATDDPIAISDAMVAKSYLDYAQGPGVMNWQRKLSSAVLWALVTGECYLKWSWDPQRKQPCVTIVSIYDAYPDPYATEFDQSRYFIHSQFMDVEQVYDKYGIEVEPKKVERADLQKAQLLRDMGHAPAITGVTVNELWLKPNRRHKEGQYVVWTANKILVAPDKFPYAHGRLPFTQIGVIPLPGTLHYDSHVKYLRPAQMELNKYHAQRIKIRENFANPKWWLPPGLELEALPDDSPNQILKGADNAAPGVKPEIIQPSAMADNNEGQWVTEEMMNIVGLHEVSQAQVPGRVEAARAIELLKEADISRLSELLDTVRVSVSEGFWQVLMLAKQFAPEKIMVQAYSREGVPEVKEFMARDIDPGLQLNVTLGTGLARTQAARHDQLLRLWEAQIIQDPERMAELLDLPVPATLSSKIYDVRLARNENIEMLKEEVKVPNSWDDHEIHLREHNDARKTVEYQMSSSESKKIFEMHCETHDKLQVQELAKMAQKQAVLQAVMQGGGGPQPGNPATAGQTAPDAAPTERPVNS